MTLEPGIERTDEFTAEGRLLTDVRGTLPVKVLSTPGMIAMMERCATTLSFENLDDGQGHGRLRGLRQARGRGGRGRHLHGHAPGCARSRTSRKLRFDVEVREGERTIGVGTHERRVIDRSSFG